MELRQAPTASAGMLIRRPVAEVFEAFVDPAVTTRFWFTRSSGRLERGKRIRWDWEMYGVSSEALVRELEENARIRVDWSGNGSTTTVEWVFTPRAENETFVAITHSGFVGDGDSVASQAIDSAGGFALVLAGLKALLEHDVVLGLVPDGKPDAIVER